MSFAEDIERIALQEQELEFASFDEETAWRIGCILRSKALERHLKIAIDVRRIGQKLFYAAMPGTTPDNAEWVRRKINVVERFHRSSYVIGLEMKQKNSSLLERHGLPLSEYAAHGGSFPIRLSGTGVVGTVTVSGLPQRADHNLVVEALCEALARDLGEVELPVEF